MGHDNRGHPDSGRIPHQSEKDRVSIDTIQIVIGLAGFAIPTTVAVIQSLRLRDVRKIRDTYLRLIWTNLKSLSEDLLLLGEAEVPRLACGARSQRMEELICTMIVNISNVDRSKVEKWKKHDEIDDYDYKILKKLTLDL